MATGLEINGSTVRLCGLYNLFKMFTFTTFIVVRNRKKACSLEEVLFLSVIK